VVVLSRWSLRKYFSHPSFSYVLLLFRNPAHKTGQSRCYQMILWLGDEQITLESPFQEVQGSNIVSNYAEPKPISWAKPTHACFGIFLHPILLCKITLHTEHHCWRCSKGKQSWDLCSFQVKVKYFTNSKWEPTLMKNKSLNIIIIIIIIWLHQEIKSSDLIWLTSMLVFVQKAMTDFCAQFLSYFQLHLHQLSQP
jgi:hypothetical protein